MSLIQNNNTRPPRRLAWRSLKTHPFRTFSLILAVFLCAFLMMALPLLNTLSFRLSNEVLDRAEHAEYKNLSDDQQKTLSLDPHFISVLPVKTSALGTAGDDAHMRVVYTEPGDSWLESYRILQGRAPQTMNEAAVEQTLAKKLKLSIGDSVTYCDADGLREEFTVCGITETTAMMSTDCIYVSEAYAKSGAALSCVPLGLRARLDPQYETTLEETDLLLNSIGKQHGISDENISINYTLLYSEPFTPEQLLLYAFIDVICLLAGILVIYSIFYLSVSSRIAEFGQMSTLGLSQRQILRMVRWEGRIICLTGISLGITAGALLTWLITGIWNTKFVLLFGVSVLAIAYPFIMLCLRRPARIAASVSPIAALKQGTDSEIRTGAYRHTEKAAPKRRLTPRSLASMRFQKEHGKTFFTVLSMLIGGSLFLLGATYISSTNYDKLARQTYFRDAEYLIQYDVEFQNVATDTELLDYQKQDILNENLIKELYEIPQVERVTAIHQEQVSFLYQDYLVSDEITLLTEEMIPEINAVLSDDSIDYDTLVRENAVVYTGHDVFGEIPFEAGDVVTLQYHSGSGYTSVDVTIAAVTPPEYADGHFTQGGFLAPKELMETMFPGLNTTQSLLIQTKDHVYNDATDTAVKNVVSAYDLISLQTFSEYRAEILRQNRILILMIVCGCALVILFGVINILNTMVSRMVSRSRELAILEAAGMEERQIRQMLIWECIRLCAPSCILSLAIGAAGGFLILPLLHIPYLEYRFPLAAAILYTVFSFALPVAIALGINRRFHKRGLMERIKSELD